MILLLTAPHDAHVDAIEPILDQASVPYFRFDPANFPATATVTVRVDPTGALTGELHGDGVDIDLSTISATWIRRPGKPTPSATLVDRAREFVASESADVAREVFDLFGGIRLPGHDADIRRASFKFRQLRLAATLGFDIPPSVMTNDPDEVLDFWADHAPLVSKQSGNTQIITFDDGDRGGRYTLPVTNRDLSHVEAVRLCPITFQPRIVKHRELRVTVVGSKVFAAEIASQDSHHTAGDWRMYDDTRCRVTASSLPENVEQRCVEIVQRLHLRYGAIDLIRTPDDRYVFLEVNPSGQYLWIEATTGLPITNAIAQLLIDADRAANHSPNPTALDQGATT